LQFEELSRFINETSRPQANYQYVVIKTLLENGLSATKDQIAQKLEQYNSDKPPQNYKENNVFNVLQNNEVITPPQQGIHYLNLARDTNSKKILKLISNCNQKIYLDKLSSSDIFIALGPWENWNHTIDHLPIRWGVADTTPSNIAVYNKLKEGDIVFYYPTQDDSKLFNQRGFFGVGVVTSKEINKSETYWPVEMKTKKSFFTHKLYLDTLVFVDNDDELLPIENGLPLIKGLNHVNPGSALDNLLLNMKNKWNISLNQTSSDDVNYWKIAPGTSAKYWKEQKKLGITAIGWNELGDLSGQSFESIHKKLRELWPSSIGNTSPQFKAFLEIKPGDIIVANQGKSKIVGIGKVTGPYQYRSDLTFHHTYPVDWFDTTLKEITTQSGWFVTVMPIAKSLYESLMKGEFHMKEFDEEFEELIQKYDQDRNYFSDTGNWRHFTEEEHKSELAEFFENFSREKLHSMKIEDYVEGIRDPETGERSQSNFCYFLEHKLESFGRIGRSAAQKFGLFFNYGNDVYWHKSGDTPEESFEIIKNELNTILEAGEQFISNGDWGKLSEVFDDGDFDIQPHIRSKILTVYFPHTFLTIHTRQNLDNILDFFKIPKKKIRHKKMLKEAKILEIKDNHPTMKNWTVEDYSHFIWHVVNTRVDESEDEPVTEPETSIEPLILPQGDNLTEIKRKIQETLLVSDSVIERIIASLYAGKNILLTGPVGTGKTDLAQKIPKLIWNYYPEIHTATSDWTTHDVIGGLFPKIEGNDVKFKIQKGCVSSTVSKNWLDNTGQGGIRSKYKHTNLVTGDVEEYNGVWLIIDEFNRANIDRAFGQLFTALEYKNELKVPTEKTEKEMKGEFFERFVIPDDYRIIGTLNTYDKHFLFHLSDALKRRFDFIEISVPSRKQKDAELQMVFEKSADNASLKDELNSLKKSDDDIVEKLYEIMSFIRKSKQLGTALLISIFKDMLVYHKMGKSFDDSLDSALTKKILPQLESLPVNTLRILKRFVNGTIPDFYIDFPIDEHIDKIDDYAKELEVYKKYFKERFESEFSKNWIDEFRQHNLSKFSKISNPTEEQSKDIKLLKQELNPWAKNMTAPQLPYFTKALENLIEEKEFTMINTLESNLN